MYLTCSCGLSGSEVSVLDVRLKLYTQEFIPVHCHRSVGSPPSKDYTARKSAPRRTTAIEMDDRRVQALSRHWLLYGVTTNGIICSMRYRFAVTKTVVYWRRDSR